jgi:hypothetical protein
MFRPIYRSSSGMFHKTQTKFLELGCPNMDLYYAVGSCYYLANIHLNNAYKYVCKVLMLEDCYCWLKLVTLECNKIYYLLM